MKKYSFTKQKLIDTHGADYSRVDLVLTTLAFVGITALVCYLQKMNLFYSIIVLITVLCSIPFIISAYFKYKYEKIHFEEYCLYFESMKMFFKVHKKLIIALKETYKLFDKKSDMKKCIDLAIKEIETTGDYQKALDYIDYKYHNTYLARLHGLLITGEKNGSESVYYNLDNINYKKYKEDIKMFQSRKKKAKKMFYFMFALAMGIGLYATFVFTTSDTLSKILITNSKYQLYTFINLELLLCIFMYIYISLVNKRWIRSDD